MITYNFIFYFKTAFLNLSRQKVRSSLSVLGVIFGVMAVLTMMAIGQGARRTVVRELEQLGTRNIYIKALELTEEQAFKSKERLSPGLTNSDIERIAGGYETISNVAGLKIEKVSVWGLPDGITLQVAACTASFFQILGLPLQAGRYLVPFDGDRKNLVCVLGSEAAKALGATGSIGQYIRIEHLLFKVVGILDRIEEKPSSGPVLFYNFNQLIFLPHSILTEFEAAKRNERIQELFYHDLSEIIVQVNQINSVQITAQIIERILSITHHETHDYQVIVPLELLKQAYRTNRTFRLALGLIAGISLIVGGIGIMNIFIATVTERTTEIGIRRAVGAKRHHILSQFLIEAIVLTFFGSVVGSLLGFFAIRVIAVFTSWPMAMSIIGILTPLIVAVFVGLFFGIYPAVKAARVDPIKVLRNSA